MVVAVVGRVSPLPSVKVVEVAVMFQPTPVPRASSTSKSWVWVSVWLAVPDSVMPLKVMVAGVLLMKLSDPPVTVSEAVIAAPAVEVHAHHIAAANGAAKAMTRRIRILVDRSAAPDGGLLAFVSVVTRRA